MHKILVNDMKHPTTFTWNIFDMAYI